MTADPTASVVNRLEAERLGGSRDEKPADHMRDLIALLDQLLTHPGPPDRVRSGLPPGPPDRQEQA